MSNTSKPLRIEDLESMNLQNPDVALETLQRATEANWNNAYRKGSTAHLPATGNLLITGDLHDHSYFFAMICKMAKLHKHPDQHLILHELIHGEHLVNNMDFSVRLLIKAAAFKAAYPDQVHIMLGNHELAQLIGTGTFKAGTSNVDAFNDGVDYIFGDRSDEIHVAINDFITSMLLAVKCPNGIMCSHSLPSPARMLGFDPKVLNRKLKPGDLTENSDAYALVWGRNQTPEVTARLAMAWDTKVFVCGHQKADMGYETKADNMLIIASNHGHGMVLPIRLDEKYELSDLMVRCVPLAGVML
ncbi:MAG TPA: hypothetical protein DCM28_15520 [Phycisphaerales bacterium]|nr:hypothetical protein [Phycisphaerales bacterium]HCD33738.1 hypothetical protein [Phycisphaerales bacterium]|tara:strand:+ start:663 stop:1568 length:906 start_codon:yes stop_codon:yes gene_type:complete